MEERIRQELALLRTRYPDLDYEPNGQWVRIPVYKLPPDWNLATTAVVFQMPVGYPGTPPYGIYAPAGLLFKGEKPNNYQEPAPSQPPFGGSWGIFSWGPDGPWRATADIISGSNLLNWVQGFADRFRDGK